MDLSLSSSVRFCWYLLLVFYVPHKQYDHIETGVPGDLSTINYHSLNKLSIIDPKIHLAVTPVGGV